MEIGASQKISSLLLLGGLATSSLLLFHLWKRNQKLQKQVETYESVIQKEKELRNIERKGRITSQKQKREEIQKEQLMNGYNFSTIGVIESPFPDRRGTPRQPNLVRAATARIRFDRKKIQHEHFKELEQFSHLWIIWVFHENTNVDSGSVAAKIKPPRLHGSRVGCLSTRSPHRPNPIGLSVSEIVKVGSDFIDILCVDMVHGTPVLDVKPYIPYDIVQSDIKISMAPIDENGNVISPPPLRVPAWIYESDIPLRTVKFSQNALETLDKFEINDQYRHCSTSHHAMQLIQQVLRQDIRSHHQGRSSQEDRSETLYECRLDSFVIQFRTHEEYILVEDVIGSS